MSLRTPRVPAALPSLVCLVALGAGAVPGTLPPSSIHPGDVAQVRTVFEGTRIDTFSAVILGTLESGRSEGTTILARAISGEALRTGVAQGMSGSPVTIGGKLIGALSSGFPYSREPIFGITPIGEMLATLEHPDRSREGDPSTGTTGLESGAAVPPVRYRELSWSGDGGGDAAATPAAGQAAPGAPDVLALPVACGGMNPRALSLAREWLAPLGLVAVPGAGALPPGAGPATLEPGAPVAIDLLRGDLLITGIGTVTWKDGDRVLLFGHPMFQSGDARMPLATATITTVVPSVQFPFKLGARGREVGAVLQDRRAAVVGRLGAHAHMLPLRVDVAGTAPQAQTFRFETVEDRALAPPLVGIATVNGLLESGGTGAGQTLRWAMRLHRRGAAPLEITDVVASDNPAADLGVAVASPLRFLFNNPFARVSLDSLEVSVRSLPRREAWTVRTARVLEASVKPGDRMHVACELEAWRGPVEHRTLELRVPGEVPDGRYVVWVGGGAELARFEAGRLPGRYRATSIDDAWERLAALRTSDALYVALMARAPEVSADGRDYPELPTFALTLLQPDQSAADRARRGDLAMLDEQRSHVEGALHGELQLGVTVASRGPLAQP